ncbi:MAG: M48 family metalloprotease [Deltaproteobacteria bacterium]|nr:M48 family metalloprotease [Deltaproteobacteria bacterium]
MSRRPEARRRARPARLLFLLVAALLLLPPLAGAQASGPGWHPDPVAATDYFTAAEVAAWRDHARSLRLISLARTTLSLGFLLALLFSPLGAWLWRVGERVAGALAATAAGRAGVSRRLAALAARVFGPDWGASLAYAYAFLFLQLLLFLPLRITAELLRKAEGLSTYTPGAWVWDLVKAELLSALVFAFLIFGLFGLIRRVPRYWWLLLGLPTGLLLFGYGVVAPYRARVFSEFSPLEDARLARRLEAMARAEGLELTAIKVIDASRTTRALNAYITGVGPSRELVLFDTLLAAMTPEEVMAVVAHELGHHRRRDVLLRYGLSAGFIVLGLAVLAPLLRRGSDRFGLPGPGDVRNLPWLLLLYALFNLAVRPASNAYGRHEEQLADLAALEIHGDAEATVGMMVKLARENHADVDPPGWAVFWFASHPPLLERIGVALRAGREGWFPLQAEAGGRPSAASAADAP